MTKTKISAGTLARTICLALALVNQVLTVCGKSPIQIEDESITLFISTGATIIMAVISWWKNNSFSKAAIKADTLMHELKEGEE